MVDKTVFNDQDEGGFLWLHSDKTSYTSIPF